MLWVGDVHEILCLVNMLSMESSAQYCSRMVNYALVLYRT